ncbi:3-oxoacyl-ACP synthase [Reichenbachiella agarivorans]|uniref:3-oxoacyl-ACP synthase n=1 Tax=Reichenbachiella agarivorans TaxID=2979464 RepID=A0ABY6CJT6_9BACT|nr:3-oxoacyl-ACP synthase [Reichenbachiella agarivorans]UXP30768.1 3-oxoacyl-ACP synthase [Reichenbachiella agarivorans]
MSKVKHHIILNKSQIQVDGTNLDVKHSFDGLKSFLSFLYKYLNLDYPKYHKMDNLSKLGFIGVEFLKSKIDLSTYKDDEIAMHFQNASASLDTDRLHQQNINEGKAASPANFVYTLPNIVLGEIAIRNKWYGENLFLLKDAFDYNQWMKTNEVLFRRNKANLVIGGWVEVLEEDFELQLYLIEK